MAFPAITRQGWKGLQGTNTLAYLSGASVRKKKKFYDIKRDVYVIRLIFLSLTKRPDPQLLDKAGKACKGQTL